jgi:hypothetical protein
MSTESEFPRKDGQVEPSPQSRRAEYIEQVSLPVLTIKPVLQKKGGGVL